MHGGLTARFFPRKYFTMDIDTSYWVYILASDIGGTLYIGVTNDLVRRVHEHRTDVVPGFSRKYTVHRLVYFEQFDQVEFALRARKTFEEVESRLEDCADRRAKSGLGRSFSCNCLTTGLLTTSQRTLHLLRVIPAERSESRNPVIPVSRLGLVFARSCDAGRGVCQEDFHAAFLPKCGGEYWIPARPRIKSGVGRDDGRGF